MFLISRYHFELKLKMNRESLNSVLHTKSVPKGINFYN